MGSSARRTPAHALAASGERAGVARCANSTCVRATCLPAALHRGEGVADTLARCSLGRESGANGDEDEGGNFHGEEDALGKSG